MGCTYTSQIHTHIHVRVKMHFLQPLLLLLLQAALKLSLLKQQRSTLQKEIKWIAAKDV